jgi:hypothetical protein
MPDINNKNENYFKCGAISIYNISLLDLVPLPQKKA